MRNGMEEKVMVCVPAASVGKRLADAHAEALGGSMGHG
jgi:hypothetical protein